jgi:predicted permease
VLSEHIWRERFASDPRIIGKTISLGHTPYTVIGVLARFDAERFDQPPEVWVPFQIDATGEGKDGRLCYVTARLKPGVTLGAARAELRAMADEYERLRPSGARQNDTSTVEPLIQAISGALRLPLLVLAGAVSLVLLIACANVASLLLVRSAGRNREIAIRTALGATRREIVRQLLTECAALSFAGGTLGLGLGLMGIRAFIALYPQNPLGAGPGAVGLPRIGDPSSIPIDWRVLGFTAAVSILTSAFVGLFPALRASRADLNLALKDGGGQSGRGIQHARMQSLLVTGEIALALVLLIGAGLLIRTSLALRGVNPGFDPHNVLTMQMSVSEARFVTGAGMDDFIRESLQRIDALPGVERSAMSCCLPLETVWQAPLIIQGRQLNGRFHAFAGWTFVSPGYFETLRIPLLRGRTFTESDTASAPGVAIINETLARRIWPNSDPLKDRLLIGRTLDPAYDQDPVRQVVGIVADVRDVALNRPPRPIMYVPAAQLPDGVKALTLPQLPVAWMVRTRERVAPQRNAIQNELRLASGGLPAARVRTLDEVAARSAARTHMNTLLMMFFGVSALLLASVGIYGLTAYSVKQRRREIGIRLALGASPSVVRRMVVFETARLSIVGIAVGALFALGLTKLLASILYGVKPRDPISFLAVPLVMGSISLISAWIPAVRASRVDASAVLRAE